MKKQLLLFALLLFFITQTKAQTSVYHPFPDSNAYWNEYDLLGDGSHAANFKYSIFINGDTIIGGNFYHKLLKSGIDYPDNCIGCTGTTYFNNEYIGGIRQDTTQKKVFVTYGSSDTLLYDFNLNLGDTLPPTYITRHEYYCVSSVDSILAGNNYRKRFWISVLPSYSNHTSDSNFVAFIEGIGSTFGLETFFYPPFEQFYTLTCFNQNGQTLYPEGATSCEMETAINESSLENIVSIYPNPATNQLTIHISSFHNEPVIVSIMNVLGIEASPPAPLQRRGENAVIDVSKLPAGIYFLEMKSESGSVVKKFVKE